MKASKHNDSNLIWESYTKQIPEGTDGNTDDLTPEEKMKFAAYAAKKGKGPLAPKPNTKEIDEASHENRTKKELEDEKKDLDGQDQKYFRVPKDHKKKQIEDAEKSVKEEAMSPDAIAQSERDNPEFSQETWILMKGDPSTNTVKAVKKYTGVDSEGAVQQLATMLADLTAEQDGLPRDEHFPFETDTGFEFFEQEIPDGTKLKRIIAIDEDYDLLCVVPDDDYMMDELGR